MHDDLIVSDDVIIGQISGDFIQAHRIIGKKVHQDVEKRSSVFCSSMRDEDRQTYKKSPWVGVQEMIEAWVNEETVGWKDQPI
jgi:hypothetical protein